MKTKTLLFISILFISSFADAQIPFFSNKYKKATLFLKDSSKKSGYAILINRGRIKFKNDKNSKAIKLDYKTIDKITLRQNDKKSTLQYRIIKGRKKPSLLEIIGHGKVTLYTTVLDYHSNYLGNNSYNKINNPSMNFSGQFKFYYVSKKSEKVVNDLNYGKLSAKHFRKSAIIFFKECPKLVSKLEKKELTRKDFVEIVDFYNEDCH